MIFLCSKTCVYQKKAVILRAKLKERIKVMSTFTIQIPVEQVSWFEQMIQTMGELTRLAKILLKDKLQHAELLKRCSNFLIAYDVFD